MSDITKVRNVPIQHNPTLEIVPTQSSDTPPLQPQQSYEFNTFLEDLKNIEDIENLLSTSYNLDKLEQVDHKEEEEEEKPLFKRARAKFFTNFVSAKLMELDTKNIVPYERMNTCAEYIVYDHLKGSYVSSYCGNRLCIVCNRIRTGKLMNQYSEEYEKMKDPYFVTLTRPTVKGRELKHRISSNFNSFTNIVRRLKRKGLGTKIIRKLECTIRPDGKYHAHFHCVVESKETAYALHAEWLKEHPSSTKGGQDIRPATKGSLNELFKYLTKPFINLEDGSPENFYNGLDTLYSALKGRRTIATYGGIKAKIIEEEAVNDLEAVLHEIVNEYDVSFKWQQMANDWFGEETGQALTGFELSPKELKRLETLL